MGIPQFFSHVRRKMPWVVVRGLKAGVGRLAVDFNSVVHACARELQLQRLRGGPPLRPDEVYAACVRKVKAYAALVRPQQELFVSVDGLPPCAKMVQQRNRRYMAAASREHGAAGWDSNCVTPGTEFMRALDAYMASAAACAEIQAVLSPGCRYVYSGSDERGEGEHKIFGLLKQSSQSPAADVVAGLDADLIMMSLLLDKRTLYVMREDENKDLTYVNIPALREALITSIGCHNSLCVEDYVVFCMFVGNDFVPCLPCLSIKENAIELLVQVYKECVRECGRRCVEPAGGLDLDFLGRMLAKIADVEDVLMMRLDDRYYKNRYTMFEKHPDVVRPSAPGWRGRYYASLFKHHASDPAAQVHAFCRDYVRAMAWTWSYYRNNEPSSWSFYYPWPYAPSAADACYFLQEQQREGDLLALDFSGDHDDNVIRLHGQAQLLLVLPPSSAGLLPEYSRKYLTDVCYGCKHYYPREFGRLTYLKLHDWEAVPLLPAFDPSILTRMAEAEAEAGEAEAEAAVALAAAAASAAEARTT